MYTLTANIFMNTIAYQGMLCSAACAYAREAVNYGISGGAQGVDKLPCVTLAFLYGLAVLSCAHELHSELSLFMSCLTAAVLLGKI